MNWLKKLLGKKAEAPKEVELPGEESDWIPMDKNVFARTAPGISPDKWDEVAGLLNRNNVPEEPKVHHIPTVEQSPEYGFGEERTLCEPDIGAKVAEQDRVFSMVNDRIKASGVVSLEDWEELIKVGWGTPSDKTLFAATATFLEETTYAQELVIKHGFKESLKFGWLTADIWFQALSDKFNEAYCEPEEGWGDYNKLPVVEIVYPESLKYVAEATSDALEEKGYPKTETVSEEVLEKSAIEVLQGLKDIAEAEIKSISMAGVPEDTTIAELNSPSLVKVVGRLPLTPWRQLSEFPDYEIDLNSTAIRKTSTGRILEMQGYKGGQVNLFKDGKKYHRTVAHLFNKAHAEAREAYDAIINKNKEN